MNLNYVNNFIKENNVSKSLLAKHIGISRASLYNKLSGATEFTIEEVAKMSTSLGWQAEEMMEVICESRTRNHIE